MQTDTLQRFLFENQNIRGEIVRLKSSYQAVIERHPYPLPIVKLLGKALASTVLLRAPLKYEGSLILQVQSDGPVNSLVAQCNHLLHIRGLARWNEEQSLPDSDEDLLGEGHLAVTLINDAITDRFQGIVNVDHHTLASALEDYFSQSEQLQTKIWLAANESLACGVLLQQMPENSSISADYWEHIVQLAKSITEHELFTLSNQTILYRLFNQENIRLFEETPVCFRCSCNLEKMEQAIITAGKQEIELLLKTHKTIDITCEFCNKCHQFDKVDIAEIFHSSV